MKYAVSDLSEREVTHLFVSVSPRYWEDSTINGFKITRRAAVNGKLPKPFKENLMVLCEIFLEKVKNEED